MEGAKVNDFDVAIVGYGPSGELLSILLAQRGYKVGVFERWPTIYELPRAVHFDDEIGRIFQAAGLREQMQAVTARVPDFYEWRNRDGRALLKIDWATEGAQSWPTANFFTQPELQAVLHRRVAELEEVELFSGWEVDHIEDQGDHVSLSATRGEVDGDTGAWVASTDQRAFTATYLVGADGANSRVRSLMGSEFHDLGFVPFDWLICDLIPYDQERRWTPMNWQLCDPARPTTVVSGGPGRRRWEFMRLPHESIEGLNTEETAWRLLEPWGMTPETARLERHAVYRFMARYAEVWRVGRLLLVGDAAHLMPPFAGQGMCNGMRDCMNLAWKLDLVLSGRAPDSLLNLYGSERLGHVREWIDFSAALGEVICVLDEARAAARDKRMLAGEADPARVLPAAPPERLGAGVFRPQDAAAGTHFIQAPVSMGSQTGLFDDLVGTGFVLMVADPTVLAGLDGARRALLEEIGTRCVTMLEPDVEEPVAAAGNDLNLVDDTGAYRAWLGQHGAAVLVRPDFYVFGTAVSPQALPDLVDDLGLALGLVLASTASP